MRRDGADPTFLDRAPDVKRKSGARPDQYESALITSPPALVPRANQVT
jgi:hypothetical protein